MKPAISKARLAIAVMIVNTRTGSRDRRRGLIRSRSVAATFFCRFFATPYSHAYADARQNPAVEA